MHCCSNSKTVKHLIFALLVCKESIVWEVHGKHLCSSSYAEGKFNQVFNWYAHSWEIKVLNAFRFAHNFNYILYKLYWMLFFLLEIKRIITHIESSDFVGVYNKCVCNLSHHFRRQVGPTQINEVHHQIGLEIFIKHVNDQRIVKTEVRELKF